MAARPLSKRKSQATKVPPSISAIQTQEASLQPESKKYSDSEEASKNLTGSLDKEKPEVICRNLEQIEGVVKAFYGYTVAAPDKIQFQCIIKNATVSRKIQKSTYWPNFDIKCKTIDRHNEEDEYLVDEERKQKRNIGKKKKIEMEGLITTKKKFFFEKHSNLIDMFVCKLKSAGYDSERKTTKRTNTPCIVFLVKCKGVIPLGEDLLPSQIGNFLTDVREAYFFRKVGGWPKGLHQNIKIGCEIGTTVGTGTICLFVNYKNEGVKGITCAHVFLNDSELKTVQQKVPVGRICYQPANGCNHSKTCGKLRLVQFTDRLDVALFDIDESRRPDGGHFPNYRKKKYKNEDIPLLNYWSGDVLDHKDIAVETGVYKFGKVTGVTLGNISATNKTMEIGGDTMNGLLEIRPFDNKPFSKEGDSGSLLFHKCANNEIKGIGILVGGHKSTDYAIPLSTVLESFDNCTPVKFQTEKRGRKRRRESEVQGSATKKKRR